MPPATCHPIYYLPSVLPMKRLLFPIAVLLLLLAALMVGWLFFYLDFSGPLEGEEVIVFERGTGFNAIVDRLEERGVIAHPNAFRLLAIYYGKAGQFKAGEYRFTYQITPRRVMEKLADGEIIRHKLTVAEGKTVAEVLELVRGHPVLSGELTLQPKEGTLLPETYLLTRGQERNQVIITMQRDMRKLLDTAWEERAEGLPLRSKAEALILASIVEKETGRNDERDKVAAVFINRLKRGMQLQADPTVIYGITLGKRKLERPISKRNLKTPTPYNTYTIAGLPPTPIANPGKAALLATLHPAGTNALYFVADGKGSHRFAATLAEHERNVRKLRAWERAQKRLP